MTFKTKCFQGMLIGAALGRSAVAQQPVQFKANMKMTGSDGTKSTGMMYFGGAKVRTELTVDGDNIVVLADPAAKSQLVLMPEQKVYMQLPIGQGPVTIPITGPADPTNPCASGGNTDCTKGKTELVNGYEAIRWDYTSSEGTRTRAWVSTKLRFPVKTEDDNGASMEFSNIAVGPQAASLFGIPTGYTKMDMGALGGATAGAGRGGRGARGGDPMAEVMSNMSPEMKAAMAKAMARDGSQGAAGPTGSGWEKTKGWVVNLTITGTGSTNKSGESGTEHETHTVKITASVPLNYGSPALGVPGTPGPRWQVIASPGMGSPEALATPITFDVDLDGKIDRDYKGACGIAEDAFTSVGILKAAAQKKGLLTKPSGELGGAQGLFKISGDLKTYDLMAGVGAVDVKETTETRVNGKSCSDGKSYTKNQTSSTSPQYSAMIDLKGLPLPSAVGPVSGSKKMPMTIGGHAIDATVNWTITPIR